MEVAGKDQEYESPSEERFESDYDEADEVGLLLARASALVERVNEIDALAQVASEYAKRAHDLEFQYLEAQAAGQPLQLLAAESLEASNKKGLIMSTLLAIIWPDIFSIALRATRWRVADAKDLTQETSKKILSIMHSYTDRPGGFRPWYVTVTNNLWLTEFRTIGRYLNTLKAFFRVIPDEQTRIREQMERLELIELFRATLQLISKDCVARVANLEPRGSRVGGHEDVAKVLKEKLAVSVKRTRKCIEEFKQKYVKLYRGDRSSSLARL